jgi:hypothetical protein
MVLDYVVENTSEDGNLDLEIDDICKIVRTTSDGTVFEDVKNINSDERIQKAIPSIEFVVKYEHHALDEIEDELRGGRPTIAWILPPDVVDREMQHSIVVTGINRTAYRVYYNDPFFGEKEMELGKFMSCWDETDRTLIKIKVGERVQRLLDEWVEKSGVLR